MSAPASASTASVRDAPVASSPARPMASTASSGGGGGGGGASMEATRPATAGRGRGRGRGASAAAPASRMLSPAPAPPQRPYATRSTGQVPSTAARAQVLAAPVPRGRPSAIPQPAGPSAFPAAQQPAPRRLLTEDGSSSEHEEDHSYADPPDQEVEDGEYIGDDDNNNEDDIGDADGDYFIAPQRRGEHKKEEDGAAVAERQPPIYDARRTRKMRDRASEETDLRRLAALTTRAQQSPLAEQVAPLKAATLGVELRRRRAVGRGRPKDALD